MKKFTKLLFIGATTLLATSCGKKPCNCPCQVSSSGAPTAPTSGQPTPTSGATLPPGADIMLKVWCPTEDTAVMRKITDDYRAIHPNVGFDIKNVAEGSVATELQKDQDAAADVFALADDNLKKLVKLDNLLSLGSPTSAMGTEIYSNNIQWTAEAATVEGKVYGFPQTSDNGYFLWYNSEFVKESDVGTMDNLMKAARTAGKKVIFNIVDSWVFSSFFFANGGQISTTGTIPNDKQVCDFANANGQAAANAAAEYVRKYQALIYNDVSNSDIATYMGNGSACAAISGTWNYEQLKASLGDKIKAVKLPTINIGGVEKQMGSFRSAKVVSIKGNTKHPQEAVDFAKFATSESAQLYRFQQRHVGPSNKAVADRAEVKADFMQKAVLDQDPYAVPQQQSISSSGKYFDAVKGCGQAIWANPSAPWAKYGGDVAKYLTAMVSQMN